MSMIYRESDLELDFTRAISSTKHDAVNTVFPGVDFIVQERDRQIWLEVKNWEGSSVPPRRRGGQRRSFLAKLQSREFFSVTLRGKFVGTCAYLALTNSTPHEDILYVTLLESPRMDAAMMVHATDKLKGLVKRDRLWHFEDDTGAWVPLYIDAAVVNVSQWNRLFPDYPVTAI